MSGKDERKFIDIPVCPICGKRPKYWALDYNMYSDNTVG